MKRLITATAFATALQFIAVSTVLAADVAPSAVKFNDGEVAKPLTATPGDAAKGRSVFSNRKMGNCLACHVNSDMKDEEQFHGEVGPQMDGVASRYEVTQLRAMLVNSKQVFGEQTIMPAFYRDSGYNRPLKNFKGKSILSAQQVEDVLAYLLTLKDAD